MLSCLRIHEVISYLFWWPGKRVDPSSPQGKVLEEVKEEQTSPRRKEALKRLVSLVKRKGAKRGYTGDAALFRLLHVDIFQVKIPPLVFLFWVTVKDAPPRDGLRVS